MIGSFGQFDSAGFAKAQAYWYKSQWLLRIPNARGGKPFRTNSSLVHIVESWEAPTQFGAVSGSRKNITVYSDAAAVELLLNGQSLGTRKLPIQPPGGDGGLDGAVQTWAQWDDITWAPGNITALAKDGGGNVVATASRRTCGEAARVVLSLDVPSASTGTGTALVLDGQDTAFVRASIVDSTGNVVHHASNMITFAVLSGPGKLVGAHNGKNSQHGRNDRPQVAAYHGLARGVVSVTSVAARSERERHLLRTIDVDADVEGMDGKHEQSVIVVTADSPGLVGGRVEIPLSTDLGHDGVLAVAAAGAGLPVAF